jgi:hypothetical protein
LEAVDPLANHSGIVRKRLDEPTPPLVSNPVELYSLLTTGRGDIVFVPQRPERRSHSQLMMMVIVAAMPSVVMMMVVLRKHPDAGPFR